MLPQGDTHTSPPLPLPQLLSNRFAERTGLTGFFDRPKQL
jgi:hypothetical protein